MNQLTVRRIPPKLKQALRRVSARKCQSLNTTVLETLERGLGLGPDAAKKRDLGKYAGTWSQEEYDQFEKSCQIFEQIDPEVWK